MRARALALRRSLARAGARSALIALGIGAGACGETRQAIGEECLRDEDCLSRVCSARACVAAPQLSVPSGGAPDEDPRIPDGDGGAPADAGAG